MTDLQVQENLFLYPTPAGAYYAVSSPEQDPARRLLRSLFQLRVSPRLDMDSLNEQIDAGDDLELLPLLKQMQDIGWLQGCEVAQHAPAGVLAEQLPQLLASLSSRGQVLLADNHGLQIAHTGIDSADVEQLSALSADVAILHERHLILLKNKLELNSSAWAIVDAAGNSQTGFWPMHIGKQRFVLVIGGVPRLNQNLFISLIWALSIRYAGGG